LNHIKDSPEPISGLPPSLEEMIPEGHIYFLVESIVESLDFTSFDMKYSGAGHPAYHPRILLKILIMGILDRVRSSRRLALNQVQGWQRMHERISYICIYLRRQHRISGLSVIFEKTMEI